MKLNVDQLIVLDKFQPRWYQEEIIDAVENKGFKKLLVVLSRRSGKDITCWNIAIRQCLKKVCLVMYCLQTYGQARKVIWDGITSEGSKFLDFIPKSLIERVNSSEMKIVFKNGSILQCIGADSYNTALVGTNPYMIVFSEFSRYAEGSNAYAFARPILAANGGIFIACSTPYGKNHQWQLHQVAKELPDWHVIHRPVSETKHIPQEVLDQERSQMDEGLYLQEYECSYERGVEGSYYGRLLEQLRQKGQITSVAWEPGLETHVAFDIGVNDATTMIFFQVVGDGTVIRIIDCYRNTGLGLDHYAKILQEKPYRYGKYFAPHDIKVREWGGGAITRYEKARQLGITFVPLDQIGVSDGIENVMTHFGKLWIDATKCRSLVDALENYRREWNEEKQQYSNKPLHNWASDYADSLRYMCQAIHKTKRNLSASEFERAKAEALYGNKNRLAPIFSDDPKYSRYY